MTKTSTMYVLVSWNRLSKMLIVQYSLLHISL